jgi:inward rectifier potassium channel
MGLVLLLPRYGLFWRFSKPTAFKIFTQRDYCPYGNGTLMIRLSLLKNTNFTDAEAQMTLGMSIMEKWCNG